MPQHGFRVGQAEAIGAISDMYGRISRLPRSLEERITLVLVDSRSQNEIFINT